MTIKFLIPVLFSVTILSAVAVASPSSEEWFSGYGEAKLEAFEQEKYLLIIFTGPWCGPCKHRKAIFELPEFDEPISDKFVILELDYNDAVSLARAVELDTLWATFHVWAVPHLVLAETHRLNDTIEIRPYYATSGMDITKPVD